MKTNPLLLLALALASVIPHALHSQPPPASAAATGRGSFSGSVTLGVGGAAASGATVRVDGTDLAAVTDTTGRFEITEVPAGRHTLVITGPRLSPVRVVDLAIAADQQLALSPIVASPEGGAEQIFRAGSEVVTLSKMVVEGYRAGRARAIQEKRDTINILDLISADAIGNLPDRNVAEAVARVPGVNLAPLDGAFDQPQGGEGRYVSIRGVDPNLNQVLVDGNTMAAPGGTRLGRAVPLDVLGASQISQIEVVKSSTPDLDGNSLGGTINVKSASAFDRKERFFTGTATINYNETSRATSPTAELRYGDLLGARNQWGLVLGVTSDKRSYGQERLDFNQPVTYTAGGQTFVMPTQVEIRPTWGYRLNAGVTANLEYRPDESTQAFVRAVINRSRTDHNWDEVRFDVNGAANPITLTSPTTGSFAAAGNQGRYRELRQLRTQALTNLGGGFKKTVGHLTFEPNVSFSYADEGRDKLEQFQWQTTRGALGRLEFELRPGDRYPRRWQGVGPEWSDPSKYTLNLLRVDDGGVVEEKTTGAKLDVRWSPEKLLGGTGFLKAGAKLTHRDRFTDLVSNRRTRTGTWTLASIPDGTTPGKSIYDGRYSTPFGLNGSNVMNYVAQNPNLMVFDAAGSESNSVEDDYDITEDIYAGYVMAQVRHGRLTLLGGLRWERTEATIKAVEARTANGVALGRFPIQGRTSYDSYFPNLQTVYRPAKAIALRGAYTQSIGRPAYEDARPLSNFRYDEILGAGARNPAFPYSGSLNIGNPRLKPFRSRNYDLSAEAYLPGGAMISVAWFRKDISDPIYGFSEVREFVSYNGIGLDRLTVSTRSNGKSGRIDGVELALYLPFRFLRAPFDGLGVEGNLTRVSSEVIVFTRPNEKLPFFRQPDAIRNLTLFYEKHGFSARVSLSHTSGMMTALSGNAANDNWSDPLDRVDAQLRWRFHRNYAVTLAARNLTREQENYSFGKGGPLRETYLIGQNYTFGVNLNY